MTSTPSSFFHFGTWRNLLGKEGGECYQPLSFLIKKCKQKITCLVSSCCICYGNGTGQVQHVNLPLILYIILSHFFLIEVIVALMWYWWFHILYAKLPFFETQGLFRQLMMAIEVLYKKNDEKKVFGEWFFFISFYSF